jgi:hypothetical protein
MQGIFSHARTNALLAYTQGRYFIDTYLISIVRMIRHTAFVPIVPQGEKIGFNRADFFMNKGAG